jgi:hypothetical protein
MAEIATNRLQAEYVRIRYQYVSLAEEMERIICDALDKNEIDGASVNGRLSFP